MCAMQVSTLFGIVAERMRADLKATRAALSHPGLRGASFEESFRGFLRSYLPKSLDVSTGVLVDSHGGHSRQLDVIISDAAKTPVFYSVGETRVVPVECAYMVIEVKANLDAAALQGCFDNMLSVRALEKRAYVRPSGPIRNAVVAYGQEWEIYPVNYFVFAFDSVDLMTIAEHLCARTLADALPFERRIDSICVLDKGVICNLLPDGAYDALPQPGSGWNVCRTPDALLLFYTLLSRYFNQTWLPSFQFREYLGEMEFREPPPSA